MANETLQNPFLPEDENQNPDSVMMGVTQMPSDQGISTDLIDTAVIGTGIAAGATVPSMVASEVDDLVSRIPGERAKLYQQANIDPETKRIRPGRPVTNISKGQAARSLLGQKLSSMANVLGKVSIPIQLAAPTTMGDGTISGAIRSRYESGESPEEIAKTFGMDAVRENLPLSNLRIGAGDSGEEVVQVVSETPTELPTSTPEAMGDQETPVAPSLPSDVQPGSPQAKFLEEQARLAEAGQELSPAQIAQAEEFARSMGTTFDPETGYSREPFLSAQASRTGTPMPGQTLSQFMRYEDQPEQRTEQFVDPQGRLRRRMTPTAAALAGLPSGVQPLSPEYTPFEQAGAMREARLAAQPDFGRAISDRERRGVQLSQADLRDLVQAERPGATVGEQARALEVQQRAGMGEFETKSPEEEELDRARKQASIDFMRAQTAQMTQEPSEAEVAKQELEIKILEQQYKDAGFAPVAVETDPQTGATVQVYRNPEGEERRLFKTGPRSKTGSDALGTIVGGGPAPAPTFAEYGGVKASDFPGKVIRNEATGEEYTSDGQVFRQTKAAQVK
jgi:hypothetical protein